jgi:hypothetical protein
MHGQPITVNGTTYLVTASGGLDNIPQTDADKLLQNESCWRLRRSDADSMPLKANGEPADLTMPGEPTYRAEDLRAPPVGMTEARGAIAASKAVFSLGGQKVSWATADNVPEAVPYTSSQPASQKASRTASDGLSGLEEQELTNSIRRYGIIRRPEGPDDGQSTAPTDLYIRQQWLLEHRSPDAAPLPAQDSACTDNASRRRGRSGKSRTT